MRCTMVISSSLREMDSAMSTAKNDAVATSTITPLVRTAPLYIRMHANDNVAIVVNDGGLPAGTEFPGEFVLRDRVPQGHKIALRDLAEGEPIVRYDVV